jgi:hypothetical protein
MQLALGGKAAVDRVPRAMQEIFSDPAVSARRRP